jgi:hypothetical protein
LIQQSETDFEQQIEVARRYPRDIRKVRSLLIVMAGLDEESAAEMMYCLPQGGQKIEGASIRFAEAIAQAWGNNRHYSRIIETNRVEKYVEAEATFLDLETNMAKTAYCRRRIFDKYGKVYSEDQILKTGAAACSIALRNAILSAVPKAVYRAGYDEAQKLIAGKPEELPRRRAEALGAFTKTGISAPQIFRAIGVQSEREISSSHLVTLRGMWSALKNGEATKEEMFAPVEARIASAPVKQRRTLDDVADTANADSITDAEIIEPKTPTAPAKRAPSKPEPEPSTDHVPPRTVDGSTLNTAYADGRADYAKRIEIRSVPPKYKSSADAAGAWRKGWTDAQEEARKTEAEASQASMTEEDAFTNE